MPPVQRRLGAYITTPVVDARLAREWAFRAV